MIIEIPQSIPKPKQPVKFKASHKMINETTLIVDAVNGKQIKLKKYQYVCIKEYEVSWVNLAGRLIKYELDDKMLKRLLKNSLLLDKDSFDIEAFMNRLREEGKQQGGKNTPKVRQITIDEFTSEKKQYLFTIPQLNIHNFSNYARLSEMLYNRSYGHSKGSFRGHFQKKVAPYLEYETTMFKYQGLDIQVKVEY